MLRANVLAMTEPQCHTPRRREGGNTKYAEAFRFDLRRFRLLDRAFADDDDEVSPRPINVIASAAKQSRAAKEVWIASLRSQ